MLGVRMRQSGDYFLTILQPSAITLKSNYFTPFWMSSITLRAEERFSLSA